MMWEAAPILILTVYCTLVHKIKEKFNGIRRDNEGPGRFRVNFFLGSAFFQLTLSLTTFPLYIRYFQHESTSFQEKALNKIRTRDQTAIHETCVPTKHKLSSSHPKRSKNTRQCE